jgi:CubicO group peptidase (beta-lactamase class C family)
MFYSLLKEQMDLFNLPAAGLCVIQDEKIIFKKSIGVSHKSTQSPVSQTDTFLIGSIGKSFTSFQTTLLARKKSISLDQNFNQQNQLSHPIWTGPLGDRSLSDLMSHTSGVPNPI